MIIDIALLASHLDGEARYDAALRRGSNSTLVSLLNEVNEAAPKVWRFISASDFLDAIAGDALTVEQEARIQTYLAAHGGVDASIPGVRTWCLANLSATAIANLRALAEVRPRYCEVAEGVLQADLGVVRQAVRRIAKSHIIASGQAPLET